MPNSLPDTKVAEVVRAVRDLVARAVAPLRHELAALQQRLAEIPAPKEMDPTQLSQMVDDKVAKAVAAIQPRGPDEAALQRAAELAAHQAVQALPKPRDGQDGKSVDPEQIRRAVAEAVDKLPKPKDGASVHPDTVALLVHQQLQKALADVPAPRNGLDGAEIRPLTMINMERSYAAGTWAKHAGGLWLARAATAGMEGWDCIVDGIADLQLSAGSNEREFTLQITRSSGQTATVTKAMPVVLDRGIYKADEAYERGDGTTWDGSFWIAQRGVQLGEKPGDGSGAWRLAVKKGRNGLQGLRGLPGNARNVITANEGPKS